LRKVFGDKRVKEITVSDFLTNESEITKSISRRQLICGHGGGNIGNQWYNEEQFRYRVLNSFPNNHILIFPQTVYFTDDISGEKAINDSIVQYESHSNLSIYAREKTSYYLLKKLYKRPNISLSPDIVLSTCLNDYGIKIRKRCGVLLIFRNDCEKAMDDSERKKVIDYLENINTEYRISDMHSEELITKDNRLSIVKKKMQEFADSEIVFTDRLHGMVFAAITQTPCIVFGNYNHKVRETFDWISYLPYIRFVKNADEAVFSYDKMKGMKNNKFDNKRLINSFQSLINEIKLYAD